MDKWVRGEFVSGILDKWVSGLTLGEVCVGLSTFLPRLLPQVLKLLPVAHRHPCPPSRGQRHFGVLFV